jgi:hypothetical protein
MKLDDFRAVPRLGGRTDQLAAGGLEAALAHAIEDKAEAAYRRGDLLEKRRDLMATWAAFVTSSLADIIKLRTT